MNKKNQKQKENAAIFNVLFCGTGGQGVLTAAEIAALAAMHSGHHVKKSEVHGMAQRGGSVESHLRFGKRIFSPLIRPGTADFLVCFDANEGRRMSFYLRKGGTSLLPFLVDPATQPTDKRFVNTYFLGVLSAFLPIPNGAWTTALTGKLKRSVKENLNAFEEGKTAGLHSMAPLSRRKG
jgi:indolepyruvate ferredoxin oxidoreductase beta subunit